MPDSNGHHGESGMVTAEYAVGTVMAATIAVSRRRGIHLWDLDGHLWEFIASALRPGVLLQQVQGQVSAWR